MATISDARSINATLSTTTVDSALLTQFWDTIEITNTDGTNTLWVRFDGTDPTSGQEGAYQVPVGSAKTFGPGGIKNVAGVPGSTTAATACHWVKVLGNGGTYSVEGQAGPK